MSWSVLVVHVWLQLMLELIAQIGSALFNKFRAHKWEKVVGFLPLFDILILLLHHLFLKNAVVNVQEVIFKNLFAKVFPLLFEFLNWGNLVEEFFFLFPFGVAIKFIFLQSFSHFFKVVFHYLVTCELKFIINFLTETNNLLQWIGVFIILPITKLSDTLKLYWDILWIWICQVIALCWRLLRGSCIFPSCWHFCSSVNRWSHNWEFVWAAFGKHILSTCVTPCVSRILINTRFVESLIQVIIFVFDWSPLELTISANHSSYFEHNPAIVALDHKQFQLIQYLVVNNVNCLGIGVTNFCDLSQV